MTDSGYSETSLLKKLGFHKTPLTVLVLNMPVEYRTWLGDLPADLQFISKSNKAVEAVHIFTVESLFLDATLSKLRHQLKQEGFIWVSWPKKSSKVHTNITEDTIREIALPLGYVDIKVCAVSEIWSGLKLVIRKSERIY